MAEQSAWSLYETTETDAWTGFLNAEDMAWSMYLGSLASIQANLDSDVGYAQGQFQSAIDMATWDWNAAEQAAWDTYLGAIGNATPDARASAPSPPSDPLDPAPTLAADARDPSLLVSGGRSIPPRILEPVVQLATNQLPRTIYDQIVRYIGQRAGTAVANLVTRTDIYNRINATRNAVGVLVTGTYAHAAPNTLAIGMGITAAQIDSALNTVRDMLGVPVAQGGPGYTNIQTTLRAQVFYSVSYGAGSVANGNVFWGVLFSVALTATNPAGQVIQDTIPFTTRFGQFYEANLDGVMVRP